LPLDRPAGASDNEPMAMTEQEWLACADPLKMLHYLRPDCAARKTLLLVCTCIRRYWDLLAGEGRNWVLLAEDFAEKPGPHRLPHPNIYGHTLDPMIFGDHWDGAIRIFAGKDNDWHGATGAIEQLWSGHWECDDYHTLSGNEEWIAERQHEAMLVRDVFGNPFRPATLNPAWRTSNVTALARAWRTSNVTALAQSIYDDRAFDRLPILADALEDAGCDNADILNHCRQAGEHVRGCWVVDLVLGKE
jgi:hypothetical protein